MLTLACETGGRWSPECIKIVTQLAVARSRRCPEHLRKDACAAFERRWWALLSIVQQDVLASTLDDDGMIALDGHDDFMPVVADVI